MDTDEYVIVGCLGSSHGIKGWSKIQSFTDPAENIIQYKTLYFLVDDEWQELAIEQRKCHGKHVLLKLKESDTPEQARTYTGIKIAIKKDQLLPLQQGTYYWADLEGCSVYTINGQSLGIVDHLLGTGANDILVIKGDRERLVPFVQDKFVTEVDIANKKIVVDWDPEF